MKKLVIAILLIGVFDPIRGDSKTSSKETREEWQAGKSIIAEKDRPVLDVFFRDLLLNEGFAFTLFGEKPMSVNEYDQDNFELFCKISQGYQVWKRYAARLSNSNYIFVFYENTNQKLLEIMLINKRAVRKVIKKNWDLFLEVAGEKTSPDDFISLFIEKGSLWNTALKERDDLIGILLGYGRLNSELFQKKSELGQRKAGVRKIRTVPSAGYATTEEELRALVTTLRPFEKHRRGSLNYMNLPGFLADSNSQETRDLKHQYTHQRKQIIETFSQGDIVDLVVKQIIDHRFQ